MSTERSDAVYQAYLRFDDLVRGGAIAPSWVLGGPSFWYGEGGPHDRVIHLVDPITNTRKPLFDVERLRKSLTAAMGVEPAGDGVPFGQLEFTSPPLITFALEGRSWMLDLATYEVTPHAQPTSIEVSTLLVSEAARVTPKTFPKEVFAGLGAMAVPEAMSPDGTWFASVVDHNIALRATVDGQTVFLTTDGTDVVPWDVETLKWQSWSPDSQRLAVMKIDTTGMARIPTVHWLKPLERVTEIITIPAGGVINRNELWILDGHGGRPVHVAMGDTTDEYLVVLGWRPDGRELLVARYDRLFKGVEILAASPTTGRTRTLMTEVSPTWLTNHHFTLWGTDTGCWLLPDGSGFLWRSERDGWAHLYHYDIDGHLVRQLTSGDFPVTTVTHITRDHVYFQGHGDSTRPYDNHLYRVPLAGGPHEQLTEGKGRHTIAFAPSGDAFIDTFSSVDTPPISVLRLADGTLLQILSEADTILLEQVGYVASKEFVVKADDGETDLWLTLHYPFDFDPAKKYPLVEDIYAGPQMLKRAMQFLPSGLVPDVQEPLNYPRALAQQGFLVLTMDGRGTPGRSKAFHDTIYRNWGGFEIADHAGAIKQLAAEEPAIDLARVGVMGGSWGGHYTFRALVQAPDVYRAGIAECPGYDSRTFTLYEVYLGMPADNVELYDRADVLRLAPRLRGKLLQTGGLNDTGTQKDFYRMSEALIRLGIQHDTMTYPNAGHGFLGASGRYNQTLKTNWLKQHLQP